MFIYSTGKGAELQTGSVRCAGLIAVFLLLATLASPRSAAAQSTADFDITQVAPGVYAVIAKPGVASNGAFIVNRDGVIVIDTHLRPSWANEIIAEIRKITDKPVRYIVNTHWHRDHVQGNQAYLAVWPGATIIQQELTREDQLKYQPVEIKTRAPEEIERLEKLLGSGKSQNGAPLTADARAQLRHLLDLQRAYVAEIPQIQLVPGTLTFDRTLVLHDPGRDVCLYYYGYGHSRGDTIVYLPAERIVMTGDALESGIPLMRTAYPIEWLTMLESIQTLDWNLAIPGHGGIQRDREALKEFIAYMRDLLDGVKSAVAKGLSPDDAVKSIDLSKYSRMPNYDDRNADSIRRTYAEVTGKLAN